MRRLTSIVACNEQGVIGAHNRLPWKVRSDLLFFKKQTMGNVVIMGRKTHDSLGGCLPRRTNIVLTHNFALVDGHDECRSAGSVSEALVSASKAVTGRREAFVIGGATMYEQFAPYVDRYLVTVISKAVPDADTFFDDSEIRDVDFWSCQLIDEGEANEDGDEADYQIFEYIPRDVKLFADRRSKAIEGYKSGAKRRLFDAVEVSRIASLA